MLKDRFNTIYFNGCSFTEGGGLEEGKLWIKNAYKEKYNIEWKSEKDVCYPTLIKNELGINVVNDAKSGGGAERIVRRVYEYIFRNGIEKSQKTLFILEIPEAITRLDIYSNKYNQYLVANVSYKENAKIDDTQVVIDWIYGPSLDEDYRNKTRNIIREYSEHFINPIFYEKNVCFKYVGLISFLLQNNIEFFVSGNLQYFYNFFNTQLYFPNFEQNNILSIDINGKTYNDIFYYCGKSGKRICDELGDEISTDGHPGIFGHRDWANGIIDFINKKYL